MTHVFKQWIARAIALCLVGPLCASLASQMIAADGSHDTTFLTSHTGGPIALAAVLLIGLGFGVVVGRLIDRREGFLNIAFVFGWVAWTLGRMGEAYRIAPESDTLIQVSLESLVIAIAVVVALMLMTNPNKGTAQSNPDEVSRFDLGYFINSTTSITGLATMLAAAAGALAISFLFGQSDLPGQSVGIGLGAGVVGGLVGTLTTSSLGKEDERRNPLPVIAYMMRKKTLRNIPNAMESARAGTSTQLVPLAPIIIGIMLAGVLAPLIGLLSPGASELLPLISKGDLPGYLAISPIAWATGALLGVPIGHSWVEHSVQQTTNAQAKHA